jgi:TRAP-type mannitol/chloroaromatic compound transport system permease large subunit
MGETFAVAMVLAICELLFLGYPVAFTLAGVPLGFAAAGNAFGVITSRCSALCRNAFSES